MNITRRNWFRWVGAGSLLPMALMAGRSGSEEPVPGATPVSGGRGFTPVRTLNGWTLPYRMVDGIKEFHLVAEEVEHEFAPGSRAKCWGYNGTTPGPTIEAVEGGAGGATVAAAGAA